MEDELIALLEKFKYIKDYLTKLGPSRRTAKVRKEKCIELEKLNNRFNFVLDNVTFLSESGKLDKLEVEKLELLCDKISGYYIKIRELCTETDCVSEGTVSNKLINMEQFNLKTAISLLPVMDKTESVTKQLISNIEMYSDMLESEEHKKLITFVLRSRLSEGAKLRLHETYSTIPDLLKDMRSRLLSRKSDTSLQQQLQCVKQNNKSIEDFGKQVEQLFVDLTISQADGDSKKHEVLKSVNEKNAIKRFAEGLRNSRISTIIAARNYSSLNDAIRAALDEELSSPVESGARVMNFYQYRGRSNNFIPRNYFRGRFNSNRGQRNYYNAQNHRASSARPQNNNFRFRGRQSYGRHTTRGTSGQSGHRVNMMQANSDTNQTDSATPNYFFRS